MRLTSTKVCSTAEDDIREETFSQIKMTVDGVETTWCTPVFLSIISGLTRFLGTNVQDHYDTVSPTATKRYGVYTYCTTLPSGKSETPRFDPKHLSPLLLDSSNVTALFLDCRTTSRSAMYVDGGGFTKEKLEIVGLHLCKCYENISLDMRLRYILPATSTRRMDEALNNLQRQGRHVSHRLPNQALFLLFGWGVLEEVWVNVH